MKISLGYLAQEKPWGGGNQFALAFKKYFGSRGYNVVHTLDMDTEVAVLIDPRPGSEKKFIHTDILKFKKRKNPSFKVLHRINECDKRKGTHFMDALLYQANQCADYTVFISSWLERYFIERWPDYHKPHATILNGADETVFNSTGKKYWDAKEPLRIVTHHWSDNPMKGADIYKKLDDLLDDPKMRQSFSFTYIGRYPKDIIFRNTKIIEPKFGSELAAELKKCHVYITASRYEPCGMHHIEGALCGLPILYINEGGGIVECCRGYGVEFSVDNFTSALFKMREEYYGYIEELKSYPNTGTNMLKRYEEVILGLASR